MRILAWLLIGVYLHLGFGFNDILLDYLNERFPKQDYGIVFYYLNFLWIGFLDTMRNVDSFSSD